MGGHIARASTRAQKEMRESHDGRSDVGTPLQEMREACKM